MKKLPYIFQFPVINSKIDAFFFMCFSLLLHNVLLAQSVVVVDGRVEPITARVDETVVTSYTLTNGGVLDISGTTIAVGSPEWVQRENFAAINSKTGLTVGTGGGTVRVSEGTVATLYGPTTGAGDLIKTGKGLLVISGVTYSTGMNIGMNVSDLSRNTLSGTIHVQEGTLRIVAKDTMSMGAKRYVVHSGATLENSAANGLGMGDTLMDIVLYQDAVLNNCDPYVLSGGGTPQAYGSVGNIAMYDGAKLTHVDTNGTAYTSTRYGSTFGLNKTLTVMEGTAYNQANINLYTANAKFDIRDHATLVSTAKIYSQGNLNHPLVKAGSGAMIMNAEVDCSITVQGGLLQINQAVNDASTPSDNCLKYVMEGGTLEFTRAANFGALDKGIALSFMGGKLKIGENFPVTQVNEINVTAGTLEVVENATVTLFNNLTGTGTLAKTGQGSLELTGMESVHTLSYNVAGGNLSLASDATDIFVAHGAHFTPLSSQTLENLRLEGQLNLTVNSNPDTLHLTGKLELFSNASISVDVTNYLLGEAILFQNDDYSISLSNGVVRMSDALQFFFLEGSTVGNITTFQVNPSTVPEPSTLCLFLLGMFGIWKSSQKK